MNHLLAIYTKRFFIHYLPVQKGLAVNTIYAYRDSIKLLLCYGSDTLGKSVDDLFVQDITEKVVLAFLDYLEQVRNCTPGTRNARLAAIRSLFAYIAREEPVLMLQCQRVRTIPLKRTQHKTVEYLEEKEMQAILDGIDINSRTGIRDNAMILFLYNTGARVSEIVELKLEDLRLDGPNQVHLIGKGQKHRSCPLWPDTVDALQSYINQRSPKDPEEKHVFLNANGIPITRFGIRYVTRKYGVKALNQNTLTKAKIVNPHTIRHTTAMHLLRSGNDINMVSYWLGHADINTTHIYVEIDMEMKRKMLEKAGAPDIKKKEIWHKPSILKWLNNLKKGQQLCESNF